MGACQAQSVYLTTRSLDRLSPLLPETHNCPSWISGRERMTVENISWSISTKECCQPREGRGVRWCLTLQPPGLQSDSAYNWATKAGYPQTSNHFQEVFNLHGSASADVADAATEDIWNDIKTDLLMTTEEVCGTTRPHCWHRETCWWNEYMEKAIAAESFQGLDMTDCWV